MIYLVIDQIRSKSTVRTVNLATFSPASNYKLKRHHGGTTGLKRTFDSRNKNKIVLHCNLINRLYLSQVTTAHIQS